MFVLDCSVTMTWVFEDEESAESDVVLDRLQTEGAVVPGVWPLEVCNALLVAVRRGRLSEEKSERFVNALEDLPIAVDDPVGGVFQAVLSVASRHSLSSYDAAYLELALRRQASLATLDTGLARAARAAGVEVLGGA